MRGFAAGRRPSCSGICVSEDTVRKWKADAGRSMDREEAIVCVDDEAIILMALKLELGRHFKGRFRIETARNAEEALQVIEELDAEDVQVRIVLTDWLMPGIKGDRFISIVKEKHPDVRCILVSGQEDIQKADESEAGSLADGFVRKPWLTHQLIESVNRCIGP
jgi:DNA-binding NtrC family response regulator